MSSSSSLAGSSVRKRLERLILSMKVCVKHEVVPVPCLCCRFADPLSIVWPVFTALRTVSSTYIIYSATGLSWQQLTIYILLFQPSAMEVLRIEHYIFFCFKNELRLSLPYERIYNQIFKYLFYTSYIWICNLFEVCSS